MLKGFQETRFDLTKIG